MMYVVVWTSYGEWRCTHPFINEKEAEKHVRHYFTADKEYKNIRIIPIEIPKGAPLCYQKFF